MQSDVALEKLDITTLNGVGLRLKETLAKLGIATVQDLLFHLPIRYLDRTRITPMAKLRTHTSVVVQGRVRSAQVVFGRRRSLAVSIEDESGSTCLRFYHFNASQKNNFTEGRCVRCYGDPRLGISGIEFYHPEYEFVEDLHSPPSEASLTPVYHLTEGLTQSRIRKLAEQADALLAQYQPTELLPASINTQFGVKDLSDALHYLHFPPPDAPTDKILAGEHPTQRRLAFEEFLAHFLVRQEIRNAVQSHRAISIPGKSRQAEQLLQALPFNLTGAQTRVVNDIRQDLQQGKPMLRMVQGDVGAGKTLVAALITADVAAAGYQVAVVAPTEILAEQHFRNFQQWLTPLGLNVVWLVGKLKASQRKATLSALADGTAAVAVGTHALLQEDVHFHRLGLSVIDEQHRFGVDQRLSLRKTSDQGLLPHQLVMTATPIPRTLAMTAYSELDYSVIDELPPGRTPIQTALVGQERRATLIERVKIACEGGAQAYWVCPLVEDSETLSVANAEETVTNLQQQLPHLRVGLVHGRLKAAEKEAVMSAFKAGEIQLLVATTVIEVGVDVPNASLMIIENPERLGLSQLHQLRGRVGRGTTASHCVLLYGDKLSQQAKERLQVMRETTDGFVIAERDLQLRGPGELLGTQQTGDMRYRIADAQAHADLLPAVHKTGRELLKQQPDIAERLIARWVGDKKHYAQA